MDSLTNGTFKEVVDTGSDEQFIAVLLAVHQRLVGVYYLFQVDGLVTIMREGSVTIEVLVGLYDVLFGNKSTYDCSTEDAASEVAAIGDEVDVDIEITLYLSQRLPYLGDVLVLECSSCRSATRNGWWHQVSDLHLWSP